MEERKREEADQRDAKWLKNEERETGKRRRKRVGKRGATWTHCV